MIFRRLCVDVDFEGLVLGISAEWWDPVVNRRVALLVPVWNLDSVTPHEALELLLSTPQGTPGSQRTIVGPPRRPFPVAPLAKPPPELPLPPLPPALGRGD